MGKMNAATLRLVLLISCGHALVHVYEHSLGSGECRATGDPAATGRRSRRVASPGSEKDLANWRRECM